jgi:pimeloyl-ACP methyl ester carboxylesterase
MILQLQNHKIFYNDQGSGKPLLLIHGFPLSHKIWEPQINYFSKNGFRVIAPDLRGFGNSTAPNKLWDMNDFSDDIISLLDHLRIQQCAVGGMSMGGYILFNLLERYPNRVSNAIFIATKSSADDEVTKERRNNLISSAKENGIKSVTDSFKSILFAEHIYSENISLVDEVEKIMLGTSMDGITGGLTAIRDRKDYVNSLSNMHVQSLVIHGDSDRAVTVDSAKITAEYLPNADLKIIENVGHMMNMELPEEVNESIFQFLK